MIRETPLHEITHPRPALGLHGRRTLGERPATDWLRSLILEEARALSGRD